MMEFGLSRELAMVVSPSDDDREMACRELIFRGYDTVGFSDCANASAWLEEETPALAVVSSKLRPAREDLIRGLEKRGLKGHASSGCDVFAKRDSCDLG